MRNSIRNDGGKPFVSKVLPLILLIAIWQFAAWRINKEYILPSPYATLKELFAILSSVRSLTDIAITLCRMAATFCVSLTAGALLAIASYRLDIFERFVSPFMTIVKSVPTMGVILLSLIWFGSEGTVLFVCSLIVTPLIYSNIYFGLKSVDKKLLEMSVIFRFGIWKNIRHIYLPSLKPFINSAITSGLSLNMKVLIAAEVLGQPDRAIGTNLFNAKAVINTPGIFAWSIIVILLSYAAEKNIMSIKDKKNGALKTKPGSDKT